MSGPANVSKCSDLRSLCGVCYDALLYGLSSAVSHTGGTALSVDDVLSAFLYLFVCLLGGVDLSVSLFLEFPQIFCEEIVAFGVFWGDKTD